MNKRYYYIMKKKNKIPIAYSITIGWYIRYNKTR